VLVVHDQREVRRHQAQQQAGDQEDVHHVQARDDQVARVLAGEDEELRPGADDRDGPDQAVDEAQARAGQQVIGERVAGEARDQRHRHEADADQPVDLARLAERAGEEHAQHVDEGRRHEQQGRPVVDLADEEAAADVEGDVQRRRERLRHRHALQQLVGAVVLDLRHRRLEPDGQEHAGDQQDDERVEGDLAQQERPVVREHLAQAGLADLAEAEPLVGPAQGSGGGHRTLSRRLGRLDGGGGVRDARGLGHHWSPSLKSLRESRSKKLGPTGTVKSLCATR
jgi:hypothetical protein